MTSSTNKDFVFYNTTRKHFPMFQITVKNFSTVLSDADVAKALPSFQKQIDFDFAPQYGTQAHLNLKPLVTNEWLLGIYDNADQAGALGYHDVTAAGNPLGKVFAKTTMDDGGIWTVTFAHELLEMLADPWVNLTAMDASATKLYAYEVCDAVESDVLGYNIDGVQVSDFVLPDWFMPDAQVSSRRSFKGNVKNAFELAAGGYISYLDLTQLGSGWQQTFAAHTQDAESVMRLAYATRGHLGSRREKRRIPIMNRVRSTAHPAP